MTMDVATAALPPIPDGWAVFMLAVLLICVLALLVYVCSLIPTPCPACDSERTTVRCTDTGITITCHDCKKVSDIA